METKLTKITFTAEGIEIDHGDRDISAALRNGVVEVGIGEDYLGMTGYARWAFIDLTLEEALVFRDWLTTKLELKEEMNND
jgi:hypothetical protein